MLYPALEELLQYSNSAVLARYQKDYPQARMRAEDAFQELMKYIWLCYKHRFELELAPDDENLQFNCDIHAEMLDIDAVWHCFLLFTRDYQEFCQTYLKGEFFHHEPLLEKPNIPEAQYAKELTRYLSFIHDHLGEETVLKWFER